MKLALKRCYAVPISIYLIVAFMALSTFSGPADAMIVPLQQEAAANGTSVARAADLARVQTALESKIIRQKLMDYGISPEEAMAKINALSSEQVHEIALHTDALQAGGDPVDALFGLMVVAFLVVILVLLVQHRIEVK